MRPLFSLLIVSFITLGLAMPAKAAVEPMVSTQWVLDNLNAPNVVFLDTRGDKEAFSNARVPGALFTSYKNDGWRAKDANGTGGMLPETKALEGLVGSLGIDNDTHVVLTPMGTNGTEIGIATRIYWTFKVLGHDKVSILDGGLAAYLQDPSTPRDTGTASKPDAKTFTASLRPELIATEADVKAALKSGEVQLIDNRPLSQHSGATKSPVAQQYGAIPGSKNLPALNTTQYNGSGFKSMGDLMAMSKAVGIDTQAETINYCNTGHWASVGWFISSEILGNKNAKMYDGSMAEWTKNPENPMEAKVAPKEPQS